MSDLDALVARVLMVSFDGPTLPSWVARRLEGGIGGVCLFGQNVPDTDSVRLLCTDVHAARPDVLVTLDEEGGDVTRLHYREGSPHAGAAALGAVDDLSLTAAVAADVGWALRDVGVDLDLAPDADVNSNPLNPVIGVRSFGADPSLVARHVAAWVSGLQGTGVGACLKHFPGHGDTVADSHVALPVTDASLDVIRSRELPPFRAGIDAGAIAVMTSHVVVRALDPDRPATFSAAATALLRSPVSGGGLGFDGLLVSDALDMRGASGEIGIPAAAVRALVAGVDLLCLGPDFVDEQVQAVCDAVAAAVASGELDEERLREAAGRVDRAVSRVRELRAAAPREAALVSHGSVASDEAARRAIEVDGPLSSMASAQVLRFLAGDNVAAGRVPWGLPRDGAVLGGEAAVDVQEGDLLPPVDEHRAVLALVRGAYRYPWVVARLRELAAGRPDLVVADLGWPGPERLPGGTVVTTFGSSAVSMRALDEALALGRD